MIHAHSQDAGFMLAIVQMECRAFEVERNLSKACSLVRDAADSGAQLVCLPEAFLTGYRGEEISGLLLHAEPPDGPHLQKLRELSAEVGVWILAPMFCETGEGFLNSAILIDDRGEIAGSYSKTHLMEKERGCLIPGETLPVWETPFGRIGCLICYDLCFPETVRILALQGAELILVPSAWRGSHYYSDWWDLNLACRALDNLCFIAGCNQVGMTGREYFAGRSRICGPTGQMIAGCNDDREQIIYGRIDTAEIIEERKQNTVLEDLREDLYRRYSERKGGKT